MMRPGWEFAPTRHVDRIAPSGSERWSIVLNATPPGSGETADAIEEALPADDPAAVAARIPPVARMGFEIRKPRNWQDFQRACVVLYKAELGDPHAMEYGRGGQKQRGIDILARRDGRADHFVGIQCRRVVTPLTKAKMMEDCRAALGIKAGLKEIIFATTAPDDWRATDDAVAVEKELRAEGHDVTVAYYGWEALQTVIALHPSATAMFNPAAYAAAAPQAVIAPMLPTDIGSQLGQILEFVQRAAPVAQPAALDAKDRSAEDPALHARIDLLRDLFQKERQVLVAERQLLALLDTTSAEDRPWARHRIETLLGSIDLELGREAEGAKRFEAAYAIKPEDPQAIANLSLARTIQGAYAEAMELARLSLNAAQRCNTAVAYLLQAAARSDWEGDPATLIPDHLVGSVEAGFGLAEYMRRRDVPGWPERTLELAAAHPDSEELKRAASLAILELAVKEQRILGTTAGTLTFEQLNQAADFMKASAERSVANGHRAGHDLIAYVNNAAVALRIARRDPEAEDLLVAASKVIQLEPQQIRLLALVQLNAGRPADAIATLERVGDAESAMLRAEIILQSDAERALEVARGIAVPADNHRVAGLRWRMIGEIGVRANRKELVDEAVAGLRKHDPDGLDADLLDIRARLKRERSSRNAADDEEVDASEVRSGALDALVALVDRVGEDTSPLTRFELAETLMRNDRPDAAVGLLRDHVDLSRATPSSELYLMTLAASRLDKEFEEAVARANPLLLDDPDILWTRSARAWNLGDLPAARATIDRLLEQRPDNTGAQLLKLDILARSDRTEDLLAELDKPLEHLPWRRIEERARLVGYLANFGQLDRAIALAYRLYLENRDAHRAWLTLSGVVIEQGRSLEDKRWDVAEVGDDVAVDVEFDNGEKLFLVVEADPQLRKIDQDAFPIDHPTVLKMKGLKVDDTFEDAQGRIGTIRQLRHKYVARFHYILEHFQTRFPTIGGFRRIVLGPNPEDMIDALREEAKAKAEWAEREQRQYLSGTMPLGVLAHRVGADVIETAAGVVAAGNKLKVASGSDQDVNRAVDEIRTRWGRGCTMDLLSFWTAFKIGALETIRDAYGSIHIAQSAMDALRARREQFASQVPHGIRSAGYQDGQLTFAEWPSGIVAQLRDETMEAIRWLDENAIVSPVVASSDIPDILREGMRKTGADVFDCVVLAIQTDTLLICDDLFVRTVKGALTGWGGTWLQLALAVAADRNPSIQDDYIGWFARLVESGHSYLGVNGNALADAARIDAIAHEPPGPLFTTLSGIVGGTLAEPRSHIVVVLGFLSIVWNDDRARRYRERVTGHVLERLISERHGDYRAMLRLLILSIPPSAALAEYLAGWLRGHFIPVHSLTAVNWNKEPAEGREPRRKGRRRRG